MKCVHREEPFGCTVHCYEPFGCTYECRHAQQNVQSSPYDFSDYYPCREMHWNDIAPLHLQSFRIPGVGQAARWTPIEEGLHYCAKHNNLYATVCQSCEQPGERLANWGDIIMDGKP
jgi:hypothetical protein